MTRPIDVIGTVPYLLGFPPTESVVLLGLHGPRHRQGLTLRVDLPEPAVAEDVVRLLADAADQHGVDAALVLLYTAESDTSGALPRAVWVDRLRCVLSEREVDVLDVLLVRDGRYWSYLCDGACCPPEGIALPTEQAEAVTQVAAAAALAGRVTLPDRSAVAARVALTADPARRLALAKALEAELELAAEVEEPVDEFDPDLEAFLEQEYEDAEERAADGRYDEAGAASAMAPPDHAAIRACAQQAMRAYREVRRVTSAVRAVRTAVDAHRAGRPTMSDADAMPLLLALRSSAVRDAVILELLDLPVGPALDVLCDLATRAPDDIAAPICTVVAWAAYLDGNGALANVAIDRAVQADPDDSLATLLAAGSVRPLSPTQVRALLAGIAASGSASLTTTGPSRRAGR